jgi:hypothetical protein
MLGREVAGVCAVVGVGREPKVFSPLRGAQSISETHRRSQLPADTLSCETLHVSVLPFNHHPGGTAYSRVCRHRRIEAHITTKLSPAAG